jgi:hypothetical protein
MNGHVALRKTWSTEQGKKYNEERPDKVHFRALAGFARAKRMGRA